MPTVVRSTCWPVAVSLTWTVRPDVGSTSGLSPENEPMQTLCDDVDVREVVADLLVVDVEFYFDFTLQAAEFDVVPDSGPRFFQVTR